MRFNCPKCNALFDADLAPGTPVQCQACQHTFPVPGGDPRPAPRIQELPRQGTSRYQAAEAQVQAPGTQFDAHSGVQTRKHDAEALAGASAIPSASASAGSANAAAEPLAPGMAAADAQTVVQAPNVPGDATAATQGTDIGDYKQVGDDFNAKVDPKGDGVFNAAFPTGKPDAAAQPPGSQPASQPAQPASQPAPGAPPPGAPGQYGAPPQQGMPAQAPYPYPAGNYGPYGYNAMQPGYGYSPYAYGPQSYGPPPSKGGTVVTLGVLGLVLAGIGFFTCPIFMLAGFILSVIAVPMGISERKKVARGQAAASSGLGAGIICGVLGILASVGAFVLTVVYTASAVNTAATAMGNAAAIPNQATDNVSATSVDSYAIEEFRRLENDARDWRDVLDVALDDLARANAILDDEAANSMQRQRAEQDARAARREAVDAAIEAYVAAYDALVEFEQARADAGRDFERNHRKDVGKAERLEALLAELDTLEMPDTVRRAIESDFAITSARERWEDARRDVANSRPIDDDGSSDDLGTNTNTDTNSAPSNGDE